MKFIVGTNQHNEIYSDKCGVLVSGKASDEINHSIDKINKLEAENAELKDVLCFYANGYAHEIDDSCNAYYESGHIRLASGKRARQVLKELENK